MPAFIVVALNAPTETAERLEHSFETEKRLSLKDGVWLVDYDGTSRQLAEKLELNKLHDGDVPPTGVVFAISNYFGLAAPEMWEWLSARVSRREG